MSKKKHKHKQTGNGVLLILIILIVAMMFVKVDTTTQPNSKDGMVTKILTISAPRIKISISVDTYETNKQEEENNVSEVEELSLQ